MKHLRVVVSAFFFSNLVIYKPYWLVWRIGCKSTIEILMPLEHPILVTLEHSILVTLEHSILVTLEHPILVTLEHPILMS